MSALPPGWYPDQIDPSRRRHWDGVKWSEETTQADVEPARIHVDGGVISAAQLASNAPTTGRRTNWLWVALGGSFIVIAGIIVTAWMATGSGLGTTDVSPSPTSVIDPSLVPADGGIAAADDRTWTTGGYEVWESGSIWVKALGAESNCEYLACGQYVIRVKHGCPAGLYVEASQMAGASVVGMANDVLGAIGPEERAVVTLTVTDPSATALRITEISCR